MIKIMDKYYYNSKEYNNSGDERDYANLKVLNWQSLTSSQDLNNS